MWEDQSNNIIVLYSPACGQKDREESNTLLDCIDMFNCMTIFKLYKIYNYITLKWWPHNKPITFVSSLSHCLECFSYIKTHGSASCSQESQCATP